MKSNLVILFFSVLLAAGAALFHAGCDGADSAESIVREVGLIVEGFYANPNGGPIVGQNTGRSIDTLNLRQTGDRLEGEDNNGVSFRGTIGRASDSAATFTLEGRTSSGNPGIMAGSFEVSGDTSTMRGTWIEDALTSTIFAQATVPTNAVVDELTISPNGATLAVGSSTSFTASGGSGSYQWSISNGTIGTLGSTSGVTVSYQADATGTQTLTVTDTGTSETEQVTITQTSGSPLP